jgi:hypothetical protein
MAPRSRSHLLSVVLGRRRDVFGAVHAGLVSAVVRAAGDAVEHVGEDVDLIAGVIQTEAGAHHAGLGPGEAGAAAVSPASAMRGELGGVDEDPGAHRVGLSRQAANWLDIAGDVRGARDCHERDAATILREQVIEMVFVEAAVRAHAHAHTPPC